MSTCGLPYVVVTFIGSSIFEEILKQTVCTVTKLFFILILVSITLIIRFSLILIVFGLILGILAISIRIFSKSYGNCFFFIGITICNFDGNVYFFTWLIVLQTAYQFINTAYSLTIEFCDDRFCLDSSFVCCSACEASSLTDIPVIPSTP